MLIEGIKHQIQETTNLRGKKNPKTKTKLRKQNKTSITYKKETSRHQKLKRYVSLKEATIKPIANFSTK